VNTLGAEAQPQTASPAHSAHEPSDESRSDVLILGLGSPIMSDDAVGLHVARELRKLVAPEEADVEEAGSTGVRLLSIVQGYRKLIVIDAIQTGDAPPGTLHRVPLRMRRSTHRLQWQHGIDFATTIRLGQSIGMQMPSVVAVYGVEVYDPYCFGERLSPEIESEIPNIAGTIAREAFPHLDGGGQGRGEKGTTG